ncbi:efflux RND transporter periplasmic adaptor subunit [Desulforhopalus sp. IMCC35007]|uniref:efflux RND transporter periplasmic adaptor subunit n=1 Tax=Desulforhopalus sp. IMCC35007 TaxID=2569543 RepID=UPI0010ADF272|nr:efflux RND transporter periplasmic adaptor subunit [Desulforhopalus sp. IMCC35007]TKB07491.1 HlyD family efflux transporter periplasmic adaptor subunit [Desulforhopalus sp. IMCC35007]
MKKRLQIIIPILLLVLAGIFVYRYFMNVGAGQSLKFSGNIEVTETQMSFRIAGRVEERLVEEGDSVRASQVLARLEKTDQTIAVAQADANLAFAEAVLAELIAGSRKEDIERADAMVQQATYSLAELKNGSRIEEVQSASAELERALAAEESAVAQFKEAKSDYERYANLHKEGGVSESIFESFRTRYSTAENQVKEARGRTRGAREQLSLLKAGPRIEQINRAEAALQQAKAEYALVKAGPRQESIDQARAKLQSAKAASQQAHQQLTYTELLSPMDAVVLSISAEPGEYLNPASPVMILGKLTHPWLRAYIPESLLGKIQLHQEVSVTTDSFPEKSYKGRVSYISSQAEFTPKTVQTFEERVKLMYRIKVDLENPGNELKPGMPADGTISLVTQ